MDPKRRIQTQTDRDLAGMHARKERAATQPVVAEPVFEDITGRFEGEELAAMRSKRDTHDRLARVEVKQDRHGEIIAAVKGGLDTLVSLAAKADAAREAEKERDETRRAMWRKLAVPIITAIGGAIAAILAAVH